MRRSEKEVRNRLKDIEEKIRRIDKGKQAPWYSRSIRCEMLRWFLKEPCGAECHSCPILKGETLEP